MKFYINPSIRWCNGLMVQSRVTTIFYGRMSQSLVFITPDDTRVSQLYAAVKFPHLRFTIYAGQP